MSDKFDDVATKVVTAAAVVAHAIESSGQLHGTVACPNCLEGVLTYAAGRSAPRFLRVRCSTPGCTAFMS